MPQARGMSDVEVDGLLGDTHISTHSRGFREYDLLQPIFSSFGDCLFVHVTQSHQIIWNFDLKLKACFQIRLVEARKGPSSITSLELRAEHVIVLTICRDR